MGGFDAALALALLRHLYSRLKKIFDFHSDHLIKASLHRRIESVDTKPENCRGFPGRRLIVMWSPPR